MNVLKTATLAVSIAAVLVGSATLAEARPRVAVLGLEVIDDGAGIDARIAQFATDLTEALRRRAKAGGGPFKLAPNSNKDLLEMKLLSNCSNEARGCMADIGKELNAERLIYGKVERRVRGYQVTLKLLDVERKKMERSTTDIVGFDETDAKAVKKWSRRLYNRLTGRADEGMLLVRANVDSGTVYVNGEVKGSLAGGSAQIRGLPEGRHDVRVESEGRAPYSMEVTIVGGEAEELEVELASAGAISGSAERPGGTSRMLFWTTAVMTAAGATAFTISGLQVEGLRDEARDEFNRLDAEDLVEWDGNNIDICTEARAAEENGNSDVGELVDICDDGDAWALGFNIGVGVTAASALAAGYFYYKGYIAAGTSTSTERASRSSSSETTVQFTPTILPTYVGAGVQIDF